MPTSFDSGHVAISPRPPVSHNHKATASVIGNQHRLQLFPHSARAYVQTPTTRRTSVRAFLRDTQPKMPHNTTWASLHLVRCHSPRSNTISYHLAYTESAVGATVFLALPSAGARRCNHRFEMRDLTTSARLLFCLILVALSHLTNASYQYASPRVSFGLLSLYTFTEGAINSAATSSADQSGYSIPLLGDLTNINVDPLSSSWTTGRPGLHLNGTGNHTRAISAYNVSKLASILSSTAAFTFELWFTPANASQYGIIAGIGSWAAKSQEPGVCYSAPTIYNDLALFQKGTGFAINFVGGSAAVPFCIVSATLPFNGSAPHHFAVAINATYVVVYLDGQSATSLKANINMSNWVSSMNLMFGQTRYLLSSPATYTNITWAGDVFLAAIYNRTLSASEVQQNSDAGIPHSVPLPYPSTLWFVANVISSFTTVPFVFYNNSDSSAYAPVTLYVSSKPSLGSLYAVGAENSTRIGDPPTPLPFEFGPDLSLAYLPQGATGYTDSFHYYVSRATDSSVIPACYLYIATS